MIQLDAGDIIKMKKKHPCGSDEWQIVKTIYVRIRPRDIIILVLFIFE